MRQWKLKPSGVLIARSPMLPLTVAEKNSKAEEEKQKISLCIVHKHISTSHAPVVTEAPSNVKANVEPYEDDEESS